MTKTTYQQLIPLSLLSLALIFAIHFKGTAINVLYLTIATALLLASAGFGLYYHLVQKQINIPLNLPHLVCFIWIFWLFLSLNWSYAPYTSWYYCWILSALPFSFLLWSWVKPFIHQQILFNVLLAIIVFYALWAIAEFLTTGDSTTGPTLYQGVFGSLFAATLPWVIADYINKENQKPFFRPVVITIITLALFTTFSRGTFLSYFMVLPILFYAAHRKQLPFAKKAFIILLITVASYFLISQYNELYGEYFLSNKSGVDSVSSSLESRLRLNRSILQIYQDYPLLGTGLATFKIFYRSQPYADPIETSTGDFGHNDYLQYLQEGGPVLLAFLLFGLGLIAWILYRSLFKVQTSLQTVGYALASATLFIHAAADIVFYSFALLILAGLFLSMSYHNLATVENRPLKLDNPKLTTGAIIGGLYIGWIGLAIDSHIHTRLEWQYLWGKQHPAQVADLQTLETYHQMRPGNTTPLVRLAEFYFFMTRDAKTDKEKLIMANPALHYILNLLELSPRFSRMYLRLAQLTTLAPALQPAITSETARYGINNYDNLQEQLLTKAITFDPNNNLATLTLANYFQQQQKPEKAREVLAQALVWLNKPKFLTSEKAMQRDRQYKQAILNSIEALGNINETTLQLPMMEKRG